MDEYKFFLPCSLYSKFEPSLSELTKQGVKIEWVKNPFRNLGDLNKHSEQAALVGKAYMEVTGNGKINGIKVKDVWIDEVPNVGNVGWKVQNRLNFSTIAICHNLNIQRDVFFNPSLTLKPSSLLFPQDWTTTPNL